MKHSIGNKMILFFAYSKGCMNEDDMLSLKSTHKHMRLSSFDFERSAILMREALTENGIDPALVYETLDFYQTLKKNLVYEDDVTNVKHVEEEKVSIEKALITIKDIK